MTPEDQIIEIRDTLANDIPDGVKVEMIESVIDESATAKDISDSYDEGYESGYESGKRDLFYPMLIWGFACGTAGYIIAMAV